MLPEATPGRPHLAHHDRRRTSPSGEPKRTPGGDSAIQRGRRNPVHQLFGQVTSRTRHRAVYEAAPSPLTNTEAPKGTDLARWSAEEMQAVEAALNTRPRKTLEWRTPAEALDEHLRSVQQGGVATTD